MSSGINKDGQYIYTKQQIKKLNRDWGNERIINANDYYRCCREIKEKDYNGNIIYYIVHHTGSKDLNGSYWIALPNGTDTKRWDIRNQNFILH
jgi:hypothetical protein